MPGFITAILQALFGSFFKEWFGSREQAAARADLDAAHERAAVGEASNETQQTISDIAAERGDLPDAPADAAELARKLRERAGTVRAADGDDHDKKPVG